MFWGLILHSDMSHTYAVPHSFHLSMAALSDKYMEGGRVTVMVQHGDENYVICRLGDSGSYKPQVPLDLNFRRGSTITFSTVNNSAGPVHLTGYLIPEQDAYNSVLEVNLDRFSLFKTKK